MTRKEWYTIDRALLRRLTHSNHPVVSSWHPTRTILSDRRYQVRATINGVVYSGRTSGAGMVWFGKRMVNQK